MNSCLINLLVCGKEAGRFVFGDKANFIVINNAVDMEKFKPNNEELNGDIADIKKKFNLNNCLVLGHIGRFNEQKNHEFIVQIIDKLKDRDINFKFLFIGDGELKEKIFTEIKNKNLQEYVVDLGLRDNINQWLNVMDLLIFPSLYEGLPVVLVEAQSVGLPCIIADTISPDVDMGLGLIEFLDINNTADLWADKIVSNNLKKVSDTNIIREKLKEKGYNLNENIKTVMSIYGKSK